MLSIATLGAMKLLHEMTAEEGNPTIPTHAHLQLLALGERRVLSARAQQIPKRLEGHTPRITLVEQGEGVLVVGGSLDVIVMLASPSYATDRA